MPALPTLVARRSLAGIAVVAALAAGCGDDDSDAATADAPSTTETMDDGATTTEPATDEMTDTDEMADEAMGDVLEVAAAEPDLGTFLDALEAAGTMDSLHGTGPFTVFAPTDEAFASYLADTGMSEDEVFADPEALRAVLDFHVVEMDESSEMVGNATIVRDDLEASNGVVHVIDHVLVPPSMVGG